ncbi:hypothetical protein QCA50_005566 [Cerrena zonata]|uniref:F-box domain-containing protein n=1 Tax=Cerrena zonata TaxID=2478898 RepID=A0AAW0GJQ2_9APHY
MSDITSVANPNDSTMSMEERDKGIQQVLTTWNLAGAMSSVELLRLLAVAFKRATSQRPKLQSLVLLDLPPEILHLILDNEDETVARLFGATCRYLRNISQSYIFRNRNLTVHREFIDWTHAQTLGNEETIPYFNNTLERARNIVLQRADMIQNRPDIQKSVLHLTVHQNWNLFCMGHTSFSATFFTPIYKAVCETLPLLTSLRVLKMKNWVITIDLLHQLRFLTCLHTLEIKYCSSNLSLPIQAPQLASVLNVYFSFFFRVDMSSWIIISICPSIQNLSMVASDEENALPEISLPPPDIEATVNPFRTLRKLVVTYRDLDEVQTLTSSMRAARLQSSSGQIPLTHLKIGIEDGIYSGAMFDLIDTLSGSSLECLVLTGVINTEPDLLDRIARALPNLLELTLIGYTAVEMGSTEWTQNVLDYAPYFSLFRRLRLFRME